MLAALILLGLLPFAAMPVLQAVTGEDEDIPEDAPTTEPNMDFADDPATGPAAEPADDAGTVCQVDVTPGVTTIDEFQSGSDSVAMDLSSLEGDIYFDMAATETGATLSLSVSETSVATLEFPGIETVPAGDVFLTLTDDATGEPYEISLADVIAENALMPADPDLPDAPGPAVDEGEVLEPADPDQPDAPGPVVSDETVISPSDPDAVAATVSLAADGLAPTDPDLPDEQGPVVDDETVVSPTDPDAPDPPGPSDPGTVLDPLDPDDPGGVPAEGASLQSLLARDSANTGGAVQVAQSQAAGGLTETTLGSGDESYTLSNDELDEVASLDLVEGTAHILSDAPVDVIDGGAGNDTIETGDEAAYAFGGAGDDVLRTGGGAAALYGGAGADDLSGQGGAGSQAYLDGGAGDDTLQGGAGDDILEGGEHGAAAEAGDDLIEGGAGDDLIRGGDGADTLIGGDGDDVIDHRGHRLEREGVAQHLFAWHVDDAPDVLDGGSGADTLIMGDGDTAAGGEGADLFWVYHAGGDGAAAAEVQDFRVGEDFLRISLNPQTGETGEPEVSVMASEDGADGLVIVNGELVAVLRGAPGATVSDVYAEVKLDLF